jgi:D-alanine-D-alanine ligase
MDASPLSIVVLAGGPSAERAISLRSGAAVAAALEQRGHAIRWFDPNAGFPATPARDDPELIATAAAAVSRFPWSGVDVAFNALHGPFGEDGRLQGLLARLAVPCTGSGADASRHGFHKSLARRRFQRAGLNVPRGIALHISDPPDRLEIAAARLRYPVVLKPEAQGSSLGVTIVRERAELAAAAASAFSFGEHALLEEFIPGSEWTVPVWDDATLPAIRIEPAAGFFDYAAKYADDRTAYCIDPQTAPDPGARIATTGRQAAHAIGAKGLSRTDLRVTPAGEIYVLEVNTSPGMTDHSLVPKAAAHQGLSLGSLCEQECRRAIDRYRESATRRAA